MRFQYVAEKSGLEYTGVIEAKDRFAVYQKVREEGARLVSVSAEGGSLFARVLSWARGISTISGADIVVFARTLSAMLLAGLSLSRALAISERQTKNGRLKAVIAGLGEQVKAGTTFHESLEQYPAVFQPLFTAMVKAGEESGSLPQSLQLVSEQLDRADKLKKQIRGALMYPGVILMVMVGVAYLLLTQVVPSLKQTFEEMDVALPGMTQGLITASEFLQNNTLLTIGGLLTIGALVYSFAQTNIGKRLWHGTLLYIPVIGSMVQQINTARAARTLASLTSAGVDVVRAIGITKDVVQNYHFKEALEEASVVVVKGDPLSHVFTSGSTVFPDLFGEMIAVGEETGAMSDMLLKMSAFFESEVEQKMKNISSVIEPILMVVIGGAVGFFAVAIISPIYSLGDSL